MIMKRKKKKIIKRENSVEWQRIWCFYHNSFTFTFFVMQNTISSLEQNNILLANDDDDDGDDEVTQFSVFCNPSVLDASFVFRRLFFSSCASYTYPKIIFNTVLLSSSHRQPALQMWSCFYLDSLSGPNSRWN